MVNNGRNNACSIWHTTKVLIEVTVPCDNQCICMPMETVNCHINFSPFPSGTKTHLIIPLR